MRGRPPIHRMNHYYKYHRAKVVAGDKLYPACCSNAGGAIPATESI